MDAINISSKNEYPCQESAAVSDQIEKELFNIRDLEPAKRIHELVFSLDGEVIQHSTCSPDLDPFDYYFFKSMSSHFTEPAVHE
ncbi:hypothetical protein TNCV_5006771, partial [Trichonephila clavipes]